MKKISLIILAFLIFGVFALETASAQLPKIKIPKPKPQATPTPEPTEETQPVQPTSSGEAQPTQPAARSTSTQGPASGGPYATKPEAPDTPMLLADTMEIRTETWDYYWKAPGQSYYVSWVPRIRFAVKYAGSTRQRFKADYTMPDGQPWFSEALDWKGGYDSRNAISMVDSPYGSDDDKKTTVTPGTFGVKITNLRDNSVFFQGKFKVVRYRPQDVDARYKNWFDFYVDQDWNLPIGYAEYIDESLGAAYPAVSMWFKGGINDSDLEARLFYSGKELATTDDGGNVGCGNGRFPKRAGNDPALHWQLCQFYWPRKILFITNDEARRMTANEGKLYVNQMPGEYIVKVFYKGEQVRETKFSIADGNFVETGLAKQNKISTDKIILPIKIMGTADKWNAMNARADGFYGSPLTGFAP